MAPQAAARVVDRFTARGIAAADIGRVEAGSTLTLTHRGNSAPLWDHAREPFICAPAASLVAEAEHA